MPHDVDHPRPYPRPGLRAAVIELMSRGGGSLEERALRAALRTLVMTARDPGAALRDCYGVRRHDPRGRIFARHAD